MATLLKEIAVGNAVGTWYLRLYEDSISQDVATNISTVYWRLTLRCSVVGASISFDSRDAWINTSHFTPASSHSGGEHDIGTGSALIGHNSDGTGSYSVGFGISTSYALSGSGTGGRTLPTIPRASSFSLSGSVLGLAVTVSISRASSSFTHTVKYQFGDIVREYTGQTTSCSFTPPLSDASQIPTTQAGSGTITVYTYNGGTLIGSSSQGIILTLPSNIAPSFSSLGISRVDNGVPAAWGIYVQGKSKATLTIVGASGIYGSSIKTYSISGGGYTTGSSSFTTGVLGAGTITFTATIVDSRNRAYSKSVSITVYDNYAPSLTLKAERCNSAGVVSNTGTYLKITPNYGCASVGGKNTIASKSFKITGTSYANTAAASGSGFVLGNNDIAISKSYIVTGVVTDALGQSSGTISFTVSSSAVPFNLRDAGNGAAFGKYAETENLVDSAWPVKAPSIEATNVIANQYNAVYGNEIVFNSQGSLWFGYRAGSNGTKISDWYFGNGTNGGKGKILCGTLDSISINTTGSSGIGSIYTPGGSSQWLGFYESISRITRKGWIGHDGGNDFNFRNDASGSFNFNKWIYAPAFYDLGTDGRCTASPNITRFKDFSDYLEIAGTNYAKGIYYTVSDIKFKKDVMPTGVNNAMDIINQLEHVQFNWIDSGSHVDIGYIANDVRDIMEGLTFNVKQPDGSDQYNINQTTFLPLVTKGMQELCQKNMELEKRLEDLENKMSALLSEKGDNNENT